MGLTVTVTKENDICKFFIDDFEKCKTPEKFVMTGNPLTFSRRALYTTDTGNQVFELPIEDAKKMAREILKLE